MRYLFDYIRNAACLLRCLNVVVSHSIGILFVAYFKKTNQRHIISRIAHHGAIKLLSAIRAKYTVEYISPLLLDNQSNHILMSNHQSLFDVPLIYATITGTIRPLTKIELFTIPIFGHALKAGECIPVYRYDPKKSRNFMEIAKEKMKNGITVLAFPEGTRSFQDNLLEFKSGAFYLAKEMLAKIIPLAVIDTRFIVTSRHLVICTNKEIRIRIGAPIQVTADMSIDDIKQKVRQSIESLLNLPAKKSF